MNVIIITNKILANPESLKPDFLYHVKEFNADSITFKSYEDQKEVTAVEGDVVLEHGCRISVTSIEDLFEVIMNELMSIRSDLEDIKR